MRRASGMIAVLLHCVALPAAAQIARTNYLEFLPDHPPAVAETRATDKFQLFGDSLASAWRDADDDGIDDARAAHLRAIAERFSPLIRRNNYVVPRHPFDILARRELVVDTWSAGALARSDTLDLTPVLPGPALQTIGVGPRGVATPDDATTTQQVRALVTLHGTRAPRPGVVPAEASPEVVLFFDLPGHDPASWRDAHRIRDPRRGSKLFVHPFIHEHADTVSADRYHLVLQYWIFYPFNDAVNAHEGDWEHINVIVTTRARASASEAGTWQRSALDSAALAGVLAHGFPIADSLVIAAVDHYFHHSVVTLDYLELSRPPAVGGDRHVWVDENFLRHVVHRRLNAAGGVLATHPIIYAGGNHKGPAELLDVRPRLRGSFRRNSGGSYPLPGTWESLGPLGVTEKMFGPIVPRVSGDTSRAWHERIDDPYFLHYEAADLVLMPDWERLEGPVARSAAAAREWAWMLLPVYWGVPVSHSLGAGLVEDFDIGNVALLSPPYHVTWNRVGPSAKHSRYQVRVLRTPVSPSSPWSVLQSGWGILNVPFAAWGLMPGYNVALIQLMPWTAGAMQILRAPPGKTYTNGELPRRFTTAGAGVSFDLGGGVFAGILPRSDAALSVPASREGASGRRMHAAPRLWFNLYFTERLSMENTYSRSFGDVWYDRIEAAGDTVTIGGALEMRQLTGGARLSLLSTRNRVGELYGRAGYGWLTYHASGLRADGRALATTQVRDGSLPSIFPSRSWWPNTWYGGVGFELFAPRRRWIARLLGYGVRAEYSLMLNKLSFDPASGRGDVVARRHDLAVSAVFGW